MRRHGLTDRRKNLCVDHLLHCNPNMYLKELERSETRKPKGDELIK
jgi:hypothetical protein